MTRLLYYLKKDAGLVVETAEYQLRLSELISETYNLIVNDVGKNITAILEPAMLEHDPILGMEDVNFSDDWQRFFRRSTSRRSTMDESAMQRTSSSISTVSTDVNVHHTPRSVTQILTYTLYVLQSYEIHSTIIIQALAQFFHTLSCELFNHILSKKKYLCRSKALQVRMNLSNIEDWIHNNNLPNSLVGYLNPTIQLLQLLQCVSQLSDVESFKSTIATFDTINPLQIKRCVSGYRYEINEPHLSEAIERYVYQCVDETIRYKQARKQSRSFDRRKSGPPHVNPIQSQALRRSLSGRESMNQIMGSFMSSVGIVPTLSNVNNVTQEPLAHEENEEVEYKDINETKDARFMLPFFVPTTAQLSNINGWSQRKETKERILLVPVITDEWMDKLDKNNQI
jgi:hypothetical protein